MNSLPDKKNLPIRLLAACFNNTSATYKYYWFLSILQALESGESRISKRALFARMISNAWYTVNYFHVSFGKQDKIQSAIEFIKDIEVLTIDEEREKVFKSLLNTANNATVAQLKYFDGQVPHWFLSPWFPGLNKAEIYASSRKYENKSLYALFEKDIEINPIWGSYLIKHCKVLKDFCYWNLALFLQAKNPSVPGIPDKLIKPIERNGLIKQRTLFWDVVIEELGSVECIYTGEELTVGNYSVEHFIPYSFVSHNLIWNLVPADKSFNSKKGDKLPSLDKYFNSFFEMQRSALQIIKSKTPKCKFLEDYLSIFPNLEDSFTKENFKDRIQPLISIAANNGFEFMK